MIHLRNKPRETDDFAKRRVIELEGENESIRKILGLKDHEITHLSNLTKEIGRFKRDLEVAKEEASNFQRENLRLENTKAKLISDIEALNSKVIRLTSL